MRSKIENAFAFDVFLVFDYNFIESYKVINRIGPFIARIPFVVEII